jgi:hypothetical protein
MKKEIIIFGASPQINNIKDIIPDLQKKYTNIGINSFPVTYPDVDYWALLDRVTLMRVVNRNTYKGQTIITDYNYKASGLLKQYKHETFMMDTHTEQLIKDKQVFDGSIVVGGIIITLTYLINWCYLNDYTDIYLIGHSLSNVWNHFDNPNFIVEHDDQRMNDIKEFIKEAAKFVNIWQTDKNYDIGIPFKDVEDLL